MEQAPLYYIESITPKQIRLTADPTVIWNLHTSEDITPYITPGGYSNKETVITVNEIAHCIKGSDFYLLSNRTQGYKTSECEDVVPEAVIQPEPVVEAPAGIPGGMKVPRAVQQKIYIKVDIATYPTPGLASDMKKPTDYVLRRGMYEFDELKYGMMRLKDTNYWVNPNENFIPAPVEAKPEPLPETRHNFNWFDEPIKYKADSGFMKDNKKGVVQCFIRGKSNAVVERGQPVYIAGTFVEGEFLYGVPANLKDDGSFNVVRSYGILMSYLSPVQMDYTPDDLIQDVEPVEALSMIPVREVPMKDKITELKFRGRKFVDGFVRSK